ncbi:fimbrial biogenesis chaperone [Aeromonas hydrophila]|uniref:fimbrial biogenesis chaperone n=1 Tax=Aeromonas hydrophila TaxID=644 RepID=UPI0021E6B1DA|nr:molecular chaperone [Aeromonas hydrophila]MCV3278236.1 molecular chaperone [Aeromonas hydrophila]
MFFNRSILVFILLVILSIDSVSAGLLANTTRVIFSEGEKKKSLTIANVNDYPVLSQVWVDSGEGDPNSKLAPFVVLPPVLKLDPNEKANVVLVYNHASLPADKESIFWINLYEVPPLSRESKDEDYLRLAMNTQMKLFYRPRSIPSDSSSAPSMLNFKLMYSDNGEVYILCDNPTPYHISMVAFKLKGEERESLDDQGVDILISPYSNRKLIMGINKNEIHNANVAYTVIDDYGQLMNYEKPLRN